MTLPLDLVLVRHGQSEGNAARRLSEAGDHSAYSEAFRNRHSGSFRLTDQGRREAQAAGRWIQSELCSQYGFDRHYVSEYVRAKETAGHLGLLGATWFTDPYLTERDWGEIDITPEHERQERFGKALKMREIEPFFWSPPNGESFMTLCLRIDRMLQTLHRECGDKRVIMVCHGEVMRAFQVRLERLSQARFRELILSDKPEDRIYNCEIMHYTRREPAGDRRLLPHFCSVRKVRAVQNSWEEDPWISRWQEIVRPRYNNEDLLKEVELVPGMLR